LTIDNFHSLITAVPSASSKHLRRHSPLYKRRHLRYLLHRLATMPSKKKAKKKAKKK